MRANVTKQKLNAGETVFGCFVRYPDASLTEMIALQGWDFLVFDAEHGTIEPRDCEHLVRAAELRDVTPIVRVTTNEPPTILRFMDTGAQGAHVPFVNSQAEAEAAVRSVKYWPRGARGLAPVRAAAYGRRDPLSEYVGRANEETLIAVHIETEAAIEDLGRIAEVDGVDVVMIAPTDLSQSLGVPGQTDHPLVADAVEKIVSTVANSSVALGVLVADAKGARSWQERGARYVAVTFESLVRASSGSFLASARGAAVDVLDLPPR